jgi:hypothetical protein
LAGLIGPTALVVGLTEAANLDVFAVQTAPVVYLNGALLFVAGLAIVRAHRLRLDWTLLIPLSGWCALALGLARMAFPDSIQAAVFQGPATYGLLAVVFLVGGRSDRGRVRAKALKKAPEPHPSIRVSPATISRNCREAANRIYAPR